MVYLTLGQYWRLSESSDANRALLDQGQNSNI